MPLSDREMFARMIRCEAGGEGDTGMRAVASVIMNRVHVPNGEYQRVNQGSLRRVLTQPGQFDCARETLNGVPNAQNIYNMDAEPIHYEIADWALGGSSLNATGNSLWYLNPYGPCMQYFPYNGSGIFHVPVGQHCFYRPTALYKST